MGDVLRALGVRAGAVVHAASGIDEVGGRRPDDRVRVRRGRE